MLAGRTAVVTGASRGVGRGIALELAAAGARVIATARTAEGRAGAGDAPGTLEDTAKSARGGIEPVRCDHASEEEVRSLARHLRREAGDLDLLVLAAWGGYEEHDGAGFVAPFWTQDFERRWRGFFEAGVRPTLLTAHHLAPLLRPGGLVVALTAWDDDKLLGAAYYDVAKAAVNRAARAMHHELAPRGVTMVSLSPGFVRTERVLAAHAAQPFDLGPTESPAYVGRAVAALAADPSVARHGGRTLHAGDLAQEYGFTDVDGRRPRFRLP